MKSQNAFFIFLFCLLSNYLVRAENKHVIGCSEAGFFSNFFHVLNHLAWCEKNKKTPVIYWDELSLYYQRTGYHGMYNVWEYFFEPVSHLGYQSGETMHRDFTAPDGTGIEYTSFHRIDLKTYKYWAYDLISKYIRLKPSIKKKVDDFYKNNMENRKTIAIHLRGTDKFKEVAPVSLDKIIAQANQYTGFQYLVASDEQAMLDFAKKNLQGPVIFYRCKRSNSNNALHTTPRPHPAHGGRDVLIEVLLMALCDKFIYTSSNVSTAVHFFNPNIDSYLLSN